jgi:hypothetical protein
MVRIPVIILAAAIGLEAGEEVQWELLDRGELHLLRPKPAPPFTESKSPRSSMGPSALYALNGSSESVKSLADEGSLSDGAVLPSPSSAPETIVTLSPHRKDLKNSTGHFEVLTVPEPAPLALLFMSLGAVLLKRRCLGR